MSLARVSALLGIRDISSTNHEPWSILTVHCGDSRRSLMQPGARRHLPESRCGQAPSPAFVDLGRRYPYQIPTLSRRITDPDASVPMSRRQFSQLYGARNADRAMRSSTAHDYPIRWTVESIARIQLVQVPQQVLADSTGSWQPWFRSFARTLRLRPTSKRLSTTGFDAVLGSNRSTGSPR